MPNVKTRAANFMNALRRAQNDRGKMAALRRAFSPRTRIDAWPVIADLGGDVQRPAYVTIAALYATHPDEATSVNFGATCRQIGLKDSSQPNTTPDSHDRRFRRLIAADSAEELGELLRAWIRLASSKGVGVDYEQLFVDLCRWDWQADDIRVRWASEYWPARKPELPLPEQEAAV